MDFGDIFGANPTVIDLQAANRWEAIDELIHHLVVARKINADHKVAITAECAATGLPGTARSVLGPRTHLIAG